MFFDGDDTGKRNISLRGKSKKTSGEEDKRVFLEVRPRVGSASCMHRALDFCGASCLVL